MIKFDLEIRFRSSFTTSDFNFEWKLNMSKENQITANCML